MNIYKFLLNSLDGLVVEDDRHQNLTYMGTVICTSMGMGYKWRLTAEGNTLATGLKANFNGGTLAVSELLDAILVSHKKHSVFFANGKIRKGLLNYFVECHAQSRNHFQSVQLNQQALSEKWNSLDEDFTNLLYKTWGFFNSTGTYIANFQTVSFIDPSGTPRREKVDPSLVKVSEAFFLNSGYHVFLNATFVEITQDGVTCKITEGEYKYLTQHYKQCSTCGNWEVKNEMTFGLCQKCTGSFPRELHGYSTRAHEIFTSAQLSNKSKYSPILTGVELEYEMRSDVNRTEVLYLLYKHLKDHAIFKRDGSLSNGVEICTRPASIEVHTDTFKPFFFDTDINSRIEVKNSCGMHVHIDKRKMSALTLGKLISFMQSKETADFLGKIAGRTGNSYSKLGTGLGVTSVIRGVAKNDRYQGLNLQNQNTAEVRIFKTPSSYEEFLKNMEFIAALVDFVQPSNSGVKDMCTDAFMKHIKGSRSSYQQLFKFTKEVGYV